jgi:hypothetical protein
MPGNDLIKPEIRQEADARLSFVWRAPISYPTQVPKDLLQHSPKWAESLIERGTTFQELVEKVGQVARDTKSRAGLRTVLRLVEQLALTDEGRQTIDRVLTPGFIHWLTGVTASVPLIAVPAMVVYESANSPFGAWINPREDEAVWPVATLQQLQLDQAISAIWQSNIFPFVELFLFDGPDLQGRFARFTRVQSPVNQLVLGLDAPTLDDQSRSLLGSARSIPGRRFTAGQQLISAVGAAFNEWVSQSGVNQFGTAALGTVLEFPHFTWDGYDIWLSSSRVPPLPKTAALRIHLVIHIDDVLFGSTTASAVSDTILQRTGGATPVRWVYNRGTDQVPDPWRGGVSPGDIRWGVFIADLSLRLANAVAQEIGLLAGASPGSVRIFPGRCTVVPDPSNPTDFGSIEIGRTDDDATIVLSP